MALPKIISSQERTRSDLKKEISCFNGTPSQIIYRNLFHVREERTLSRISLGILTPVSA